MVYRALFLTAFLVSLWIPRAALASPEEDVKALFDKGVAAYDDLDFDGARTNLEKALVTIARNQGKVSPPLVAKVQVRLGVLYVSVDKDKAKGLKSFINALKADPSASVDPALLNPDISAVFGDAKEAVGGSGQAPAPQGPLLLSHKPPREAS